MDDFEKYQQGLCGGGDCLKQGKHQGYCKYHYYKMKERGVLGNRERCLEFDCELFGVVRGLCGNHYRKALRKGELKATPREVCKWKSVTETCWDYATAKDGYCKKHRPVKKCTEEGCERPQKSRGLCGTHYQADRRKKIRGA